jgi:hypothetical protein
VKTTSALKTVAQVIRPKLTGHDTRVTHHHNLPHPHPSSLSPPPAPSHPQPQTILNFYRQPAPTATSSPASQTTPSSILLQPTHSPAKPVAAPARKPVLTPSQNTPQLQPQFSLQPIYVFTSSNTLQSKSTPKSSIRQTKVRIPVKPDPTDPQYLKFQVKIGAEDLKAQFDPLDWMNVRCSRCGGWSVQRAKQDIRRFKEHRKGQKCRDAKCTQSTLHTILAPHDNAKSAQSICKERIPCSGIGAVHHPRIPVYLGRTSMFNGGAPRRPELVDLIKARRRRLHQKRLTKKQLKDAVMQEERARALSIRMKYTMQISHKYKSSLLAILEG